jgi:D-alanine transaminase
MTAQIACLNGEFLPLEDARVPVLDRGFIFGDGVYEVIPVYDRVAFRLEEHLARLDRSLAAIKLANPHDHDAWRALIESLIARHPWADQSVYLHVTRGVAPRNHAFPTGVKPTVFMMSGALRLPSEAERTQGVSALSLPDFRWLRCDIKSIALLGNCLLRQAAVEAGCKEAVLFRDGWLTEGAASNIFVVSNGTLLAPPADHLILPGITYELTIELARAHGLPCEVRPVSEAETRAADELWLTSSTNEVLAITRLDDQPVGNGLPGPVWHQMSQWISASTRAQRQRDGNTPVGEATSA